MRRPSPPRATPRQTATSRSPPRRACGSAGRSRGDRASSGPADGDEVQRAIEVPAAQREVLHADSGDEAVVEALGEPELRVDVVPARVANRQLVRAQLARVEEAEHVDMR